MSWRPRPSDRFYRVIVRTGLVLRALFRIRVIVTGQEHLPTPDPGSESGSGPPSGPRSDAAHGAPHGTSRGPSRPAV
ncbi:MAG TPA: hypothetical protein VF885_19990, partial [Arthrobacter sp.]